MKGKKVCYKLFISIRIIVELKITDEFSNCMYYYGNKRNLEF